MKLILRKGVFLFSMILLFGLSAGAQTMKQKVADKYFDQLNYFKAVEIYKDIVSGKDKDYHNLKRTAECYYLMNNSSEAESWYKELIDFGTDFPKDYYIYAQLLKRNGKYEASDKNMELFYNKAGKGTFTSTPNFYDKLKSDSAYFVVSTLDFNSPESDIAPIIYNGELLFVSNRRDKMTSDIEVGWDATNFLDIYTSGENGSNSTPTLFFGKDLTKNSHDGPISFDTINNKIYITRNNITEKNQNKNLKIEIFENSNNSWNKIEEFPFNSNEYSVGHTTFSPDGKTIYFTSNMPGSLGETDIWKSVLKNGKWGTPINLGEEINTFDKEMFPYISPDGDLYFASQGHQGFGGLDIFVAYKKGDGFMKPVNMGYPINTRFDDFSFIILENNKVGYFSSNRVGGRGQDDIYKVEIKKQINKPTIEKEIAPDYLVKGNLFDKENNEILTGASLTLLNIETNEEIDNILTDKGFNFKLQAGTQYQITFKKDGYISKVVNFDTDNETYEIVLNELLDREAISINNIFYDFNSSALRNDSKSELDKLVKLLKEYPEMSIQINAHTDCVGMADYNLKLSERRARSVMNYLVSKGIDKSRLRSKGYGESRHVNKCVNNTIECTEAEHQENRRTEFVIIK